MLMENQKNCLEVKIMRRVRVVYWCRQITQPVALKVWALGGFLGFLLFQVSLFSVWANSPSVASPSEFSRFLVFAVRETEWVVKIGLIGLSLVGLSFVLPLLKNLNFRLPLPRRLPFLRA